MFYAYVRRFDEIDIVKKNLNKTSGETQSKNRRITVFFEMEGVVYSLALRGGGGALSPMGVP